MDNNIKYSAYSDIVHKNNSGVMVVPALGLNGISMASFFNWFTLGKELYLNAWWGSATPKIEDISYMIENDIPVIISMGPSYSEDGITMYKEIPLNGNEEKCATDIKFKEHYVTITGVTFNVYTDDIWLKVSSWGRCYYIDFNEYLTYAGYSIANNILHIDIL